MFARHPRNRSDERHPSPRSFDLVEAQDKTCAQPGFDSADMPLDLFSRLNCLAVRCDQRFGQSSMKMIACLHRRGVKLIRKLDEKDGTLWHNVAGYRQRVLRHHGYAEEDNQRNSNKKGQTESAHPHRDLPRLELLCDWMEEKGKSLPQSLPESTIFLSTYMQQGPQQGPHIDLKTNSFHLCARI